VIVERGTVVLGELDPTVGHVQHGVRPCIAVSDPQSTLTSDFLSSRWYH
jgi:mRNA-degrading endonuclease toxin of MazEF toxin-antitoxin module